MTKLEIDVGRDLRSVAAEVGAAWKAAIAGEPVQGSDRIIFIDWYALCAVLTPERYDLLRALARTQTSDLSKLAQKFGRDRSAIEADLRTLAGIGLVTEDRNGNFSAAADEIASTIRIAA